MTFQEIRPVSTNLAFYTTDTNVEASPHTITTKWSISRDLENPEYGNNPITFEEQYFHPVPFSITSGKNPFSLDLYMNPCNINLPSYNHPTPPTPLVSTSVAPVTQNDKITNSNSLIDDPKFRSSLYPNQRLNFRDNHFPFEDSLRGLSKEEISRFVLSYERCLFDYIFDLQTLGISGYFGNYVYAKFWKLYYGFFRQMCTRRRVFQQKLYAALKITLQNPEFYPLLGAMWISEHHFKVNATTFGMAINTCGGKAKSAIFNNCGLFAKHGFEEVPRSRVEGIVSPGLLQDVDEFNVRVIADPMLKFGINSMPSEMKRFKFRKTSGQKQ